MDENTIQQEDETVGGGLPLMGAKGQPPKTDAPVLGEVKAQNKGKSNISRLVIATGSVALIFTLSGALMFYQKYKKKKVPEQAVTQEAPGYKQRNDQLENDYIQQKKEEIAAAEAAKQQALKEEEERKRQEEIARASGGLTKRSQVSESASQPPAAGNGTQAAQAAGNGCPNGNCGLTPDERKMSGDVLVGFALEGSGSGFQANGGAASGSSRGLPANYPSRPTAPDINALMGNKKEEVGAIAKQLKPTVMEARYAGSLSNLDYLLKRGTIIPCLLLTGIDTTLSGFVLCTVSNDVYSANGKTLLVTRGAVIHGEQQSALKLGQARVFVLWNRLDNPDGTFAELDSPGTDAMGYNGIGGYVDTHFGERFGAAILISVIKDATQFALSNLAQNSQSQFAPTNTANAGTSMAQDVLRNDMNIPPTLTVLPSTPVNVLVSRDVSFENMYKVVQ